MGQRLRSEQLLLENKHKIRLLDLLDHLLFRAPPPGTFEPLRQKWEMENISRCLATRSHEQPESPALYGAGQVFDEDGVAMHELFNSYPADELDPDPSDVEEEDEPTDVDASDKYWLKRYRPDDEGWHRWAYFRFIRLSQEIFTTCCQEYQFCQLRCGEGQGKDAVLLRSTNPPPCAVGWETLHEAVKEQNYNKLLRFKPHFLAVAGDFLPQLELRRSLIEDRIGALACDARPGPGSGCEPRCGRAPRPRRRRRRRRRRRPSPLFIVLHCSFRPLFHLIR